MDDGLARSIGSGIVGAITGVVTTLATVRGRFALIERNHVVLETEMRAEKEHAREILKIELDTIRRDINNVASIARRATGARPLDDALAASDGPHD